MLSQMMRKCFAYSLILAALSILSLSEYLQRVPLLKDDHQKLRDDLIGLLSSSAIQWLVVLFFGLCFLAMRLLKPAHPTLSRSRESKQSSSGFFIPRLFSYLFMVLALLRYVVGYPDSSGSTDFLVIGAAFILGETVAFVNTILASKRSPLRLGAILSDVYILLLTMLVLNVVSLQRGYQYRGQLRWNGPWLEPDTCGLMMGIGFILATGSILRTIPGFLFHRGNGASKIGSNKIKLFQLACYFSGAVIIGSGLIKSYSRGAWLGAGCAVLYLLAGYKQESVEMEACWCLKEDTTKGEKRFKYGFPFTLRRLLFSCVLIIISIGTLASFRMQDIESPFIRRSLSPGNFNDFSWRNRVATYEGGLQMIASKPWVGFGWNQPEWIYSKYFQPDTLPDGGAIRLNNYLTLAMTLGIPALLCFLAYIYSLFRTGETFPFPAPEGRPYSYQFSRIFLAANIVLLIGFWFDGGLFQITTAAPFWIFMELGNTENARYA